MALLAAISGREIEQILMQNNMPDKVLVEDFAYSVERGRGAIETAVLKSSYQNHYADNHSESDRQSRDTRRTRSPRVRDVRDVRDTRDPRNTRDVQDVRELRDPRYDTRGIPRDVRDRRY